jgi:hypothetical protein
MFIPDRIPDPYLDFLPIQDPRSRIPGSKSLGGTRMYYDSGASPGTGFKSRSNIKCNEKVKQNQK